MTDRSAKSSGRGNAVDLVEGLLKAAIRDGASDVHFEPTSQGLVVRFRLDGVLEDVEKLPKSLAENVVSRLKVLGGLLTYRNDIPQEGRLQITGDSGDEVVDQRISVFPTIHGQRAVVRLLYAHRSLSRLDELGFSPAILASLEQLAGANQGLLLLTGPAGSGKSTTLAAMLRAILTRWPGKSIVTLEDPVERPIEGVTQAQISPHGQMTFPVALRSLLRQDPQVLMIGEIRDAQTAQISVEASLTGHLLMSTMHSGTPAGAMLRLLEMGIEPYQVTSSVLAVLNQRLVRRLCDACRTTDAATGLPKAAGCEQCYHTGFRGRALVAELVHMDGELRRALLAKADLDQLEEVLRQRGHMTLVQDGLRLLSGNVTTQDELQQACGRLMPG